MNHFTYAPKGVCAVSIEYDLDEDKRIHNLKFTGGCNGNLKAIGKLLEGEEARRAADILKGNDCKNRGTSCADQLSKSLYEAIL